MNISLFFITVLLVFLGTIFYIDKRIVGVLVGNSHKRSVIRWVIFAFFLVVVVSKLAYRGWSEFQATKPMSALQWVGESSFAFFGLLFVWAFFKDLCLLLWTTLRRIGGKILKSKEKFIISETILRTSAILALFCAGMNAAIGMWVVAQGPQLIEATIPIQGLPKPFQGFRIVQLSDIHIGPTIQKDYVEGIVKSVNSLNADIVCVTGDAIDGKVEELRDFLTPFLNMKSKHGIFYVTGNHEYYWGGKEWLNEFKRLGFFVLHNSHVKIDKEGFQMAIAGMPDRMATRFHADHQEDPAKAIKGAESSDVRIMLAHQPISIYKTVEQPFHLQLSGHTHAGQHFPITLAIHLLQPFVKGLNSYKGMWLYVNQGTGYYGPPMRAGTVPEISLLTLVSSDTE